jgi:hypothetical protein
MLRKKKHSTEEIATKLAQADELATQGKLQSEIARTLGVSIMTLHRWRKAPPGPWHGSLATYEASQPEHTRAAANRIAELTPDGYYSTAETISKGYRCRRQTFAALHKNRIHPSPLELIDVFRWHIQHTARTTARRVFRGLNASARPRGPLCARSPYGRSKPTLFYAAHDNDAVNEAIDERSCPIAAECLNIGVAPVTKRVVGHLLEYLHLSEAVDQSETSRAVNDKTREFSDRVQLNIIYHHEAALS